MLSFCRNPVQQQITTVLIYFIEDFPATLLVHFYFFAHGDEILQGRIACGIDRCSMLTVIALRAKSQVVGRCQMALA